MYNGTVQFVATVKGNGVTFPLFEFNPKKRGVSSVKIEASNGSKNEIRSTVHLASIASTADGRAVAIAANTSILNRISYVHTVAIENARIVDEEFSNVSPVPGVVEVTAAPSMLSFTGKVKAMIGITPVALKMELERASFPGERNFGLFRVALDSESPVEAFMVLYNILLMLNNDKQKDVDAFIVSEEPAVLQTQKPGRKRGVLETVYTRLRNELGHKRPKVDLVATKAQMAGHLGGLTALAKKTIELHP